MGIVEYEEDQVLGFISDGTGLYAQRGRPLDPAALVWPSRVTFDACVDRPGHPAMGWAASRAKHLAALKVALALVDDPPPDSRWHVPPGPPSVDLLRAVVQATAAECPHLTAPYATDAQALSAATELLLRIIWHLYLAGFEQVGRQRNPSGLISNDKVCVVIEGTWRAFDVMTLGWANHPTVLSFSEAGAATPILDSGIPDGV